MSQSTLEGGCSCGGIRYRLSGEPLVSGICHCSTCRRTCGAPMMPFVTFPSDRFELTRGKPLQFQSSPHVPPTFCVVSSTPVTYHNKIRTNETDRMRRTVT